MDHFWTAWEPTCRWTLLSLNFPFAIPSNPHNYGLTTKNNVQNFSSFDWETIVLGRCQSGPLCSHRLHQPLCNSISWCQECLSLDRQCNWHVCQFQSLPSVQRREEEGKSLVVDSVTEEKPEGFSFTFQFQFPTVYATPHFPLSSCFPAHIWESSGGESPQQSRASRRDPDVSCPGESLKNFSHLYSHHGVRISLLCSLNEPRTQTFACGQFWLSLLTFFCSLLWLLFLLLRKE